MKKRYWITLLIALFAAVLLPTVAQAKTVTVQPKKKEKYRYKVDKNLVRFETLKLGSSVDRLHLSKDVWYLYYWEDLAETDYANAQGYDNHLEKAKSIKTITVAKGNKKLKAIDGILMNKKGTYLECCPPAKEGKVVIPEGIKYIGNRAFAGCDKVTEIHLPASVKGVGEAAFWGMKSLKKITISSKNKKFKVVDNVLYSANGKDLVLYPAADPREEFIVPSNVSYCYEAAFSASQNLKKVILPEGQKRLNNSLFQNSKVETVTLPKSVRYIDAEVFSGCKKLKEIQLHEGLLGIYEAAFCNTESLLDVYLPNSLICCEEMFGFFEKEAISKKRKVYVYQYSKAAKDMGEEVEYYGSNAVTPLPAIQNEGAVKGTGTPDTSWYKKGKKSYVISNPDQLAGMAVLTKKGVTFKNVTFTLENDLDLSCYQDWEPIGPGKQGKYVIQHDKRNFRGSFDGKNHTIYNLTCIRYDKMMIGLFGSVKGEIRNVSVKNAAIAGEMQTGVVVGRMEGTIQNCTVSGTVYGMEQIGGICGNLEEDKSRIVSCKNDAEVRGYEEVGGIVGLCGFVSDPKVKKCYNYGNISGSYSVAGIAGVVDTKKQIKNCQNKGVIKGYKKVSSIMNKEY